MKTVVINDTLLVLSKVVYVDREGTEIQVWFDNELTAYLEFDTEEEALAGMLKIKNAMDA